MARTKNKIERISLSGGLIGLFTTNPRRALEKCIENNNNEGWNCHQILPHATSNLAAVMFQIIVLVCTVGLWTFGAGYLVLFEKEE